MIKPTLIKSVALYVILVGLPLAGLIAILDQGQTLVPPPSVGGSWVLASDQTLICAGEHPVEVLAIEQSGRFVRVRLGDMPFGQGRIDGDRLHALAPVTLTSCAGGAAAIEATFADAGRVLVGTIDARGCEACRSSALAARRTQPRH
jgi:hypothetical protein